MKKLSLTRLVTKQENKKIELKACSVSRLLICFNTYKTHAILVYMITINTPVPDFELDAYQANDIKKIKLSDYKGKWVVLIFYPADFTFVCPTELEDAQKYYADVKKLGGEIMSISTDTAFVHKAWHDNSPAIGKIEYPMLADPTGNISRLFGTLIESEGLALRGTFIIDPDGVLKTIEIHDNSIGRSAKEMLRKLQAAKFVRENTGNVCPASWEMGDDTLKPGVDLIGKI
jgi:peroxiredoxin (alkyl hydroperoxide reductase subunit C)